MGFLPIRCSDVVDPRAPRKAWLYCWRAVWRDEGAGGRVRRCTVWWVKDVQGYGRCVCCTRAVVCACCNDVGAWAHVEVLLLRVTATGGGIVGGPGGRGCLVCRPRCWSRHWVRAAPSDNVVRQADAVFPVADLTFLRVDSGTRSGLKASLSVVVTNS